MAKFAVPAELVSSTRLSFEARTGARQNNLASLPPNQSPPEFRIRAHQGKSPWPGEGSTAETATGELTGIGDEAYEMGDTMARFIFNECPCSADAIKPLAEKVVSQL